MFLRFSQSALLIFFCFLSPCFSINWLHSSNTQKCLKEELEARILITGEYEVAEIMGQKLDYIIRDSKGHVLSRKEDISKGKFSFVTEVHDAYEICFISRSSVDGIQQEINLKTKKGVEAKNYEGVAEVAKLKPMELQLKRLEDLANSIVQDFALMRKRTEQMTNTNESTHSRVTAFAIFSLLTLCCLELWELMYYRRYFKSKKLIQ